MLPWARAAPPSLGCAAVAALKAWRMEHAGPVAKEVPDAVKRLVAETPGLVFELLRSCATQLARRQRTAATAQAAAAQATTASVLGRRWAPHAGVR
ncbi:hypothetical protein TSOC_012717, partial [Tetrabaena socialis]